MLLFCVRDTGIGIPYALQERVFDSFTQADNTITRRYGGTGLGLTICKEIVRLMKGAIWVDSEYGKGSSFYFTALFGMEDRPCVGTEPSQGETLKAEALSWPDKIRILVAEDDRLNQKVMSMMLNKYGLDYVIVENGRQVMEELERGHYDLILMDVQMPEMDGLEATRLIRTSSSGAFDPKIPIVAVTAFAMKEDVERCISAGMDEYISKPIKADRLMEVINRVLKKGA
jgi:CheY-like chemotaxis protein